MPEVQARKHIIDEVGPIEFFTELVNFCGPKRSGEIFGQTVIWGMAGLQSKAEILAYLQRAGFSQRSAYRLVDDFSDFLHHLEGLHGWHGTLADGVSEMRALAGCQI